MVLKSTHFINNKNVVKFNISTLFFNNETSN